MDSSRCFFVKIGRPDASAEASLNEWASKKCTDWLCTLTGQSLHLICTCEQPRTMKGFKLMLRNHVHYSTGGRFELEEFELITEEQFRERKTAHELARARANETKKPAVVPKESDMVIVQSLPPNFDDVARERYEALRATAVCCK